MNQNIIMDDAVTVVEWRLFNNLGLPVLQARSAGSEDWYNVVSPQADGTLHRHDGVQVPELFTNNDGRILVLPLDKRAA